MENSQANTNPPIISQDINILEGETFLVCNETGDVTGSGAFGLFSRDTRFLSRFNCSLNGKTLNKLTSRQSSYFESTFYLSNKEDSQAKQNTISVIRRHVIDKSLWQSFVIENHNNHAVDFNFCLEFAADFADLFEVKSTKQRQRSIASNAAEDGSDITFTYMRESLFRKTRISFSQPAKIQETTVNFNGSIKAKSNWSILVRVDMFCDKNAHSKPSVDSGFIVAESEMKRSLRKWKTSLPSLKTDHVHLKRCYDRSCMDLASLQIDSEGIPGPEPILAAGLPWFMTLFGRDSLIAGYQSLIIGSSLAERTLMALALQQSTETNDFRDEQPGKILHEVRHGELTVFGDLPYSPYFGSIDSTLLFLILASEVYRWTGNADFLHKLKNNLERALDWIETSGDSDKDGYVEYQTKSSKGLRNQGWKDSGDGIQFFDGTLADPPIALAEVQGYLFDAYHRSSEMMLVLGEKEKARACKEKADSLQKRFLADFWSDHRSAFALGLDRNKSQIDSVCSNIGHLLWSGILDPERAKTVADILMSESMYSGWGVRTLSNRCGGYNPIGYHTGTVWPHDNSIIAAGLMRYGFVDQSLRMIEDMLDAAESFQYRLPEAFAGYNRDGTRFPAIYPTSCSPQAWASGAPLLFLRTMLGLQPDLENRTLIADPHLPKQTTSIVLDGVPAFGDLFSVRVENDKVHVDKLNR